MKVSTKVEYGVLALADIALYSENGQSVSAVEISKRQGISKKYLEQILPLLRQAGLIRAHKGLRGGYTLSCCAESVTLSDILNALDYSILEEMEESSDQREGCLRNAVNACVWTRMNHIMSDYARGLTLSAFVEECRSQGEDGWDLYVI